MNKYLSRSIFFTSVTAIAVTGINKPELLGNSNKFLHELVGANLISIIGIIVTITLASTANIQLQISRAEERLGKEIFKETRDRMRISSFVLILTLILAVMISIVKPFVMGHLSLEVLVNSLAVILILLDVLILWDVTQAVFDIRFVKDAKR